MKLCAWGGIDNNSSKKPIECDSNQIDTELVVLLKFSLECFAQMKDNKSVLADILTHTLLGVHNRCVLRRRPSKSLQEEPGSVVWEQLLSHTVSSRVIMQLSRQYNALRGSNFMVLDIKEELGPTRQ